MAEETGRPQDQGRKHRRKAEPSPETRALLERWRDGLRAELTAILDALEARADPGLGMVDPPLALALEDPKRDRLVDRGIKVANHLGAEVDPPAPPSTTSPTDATPMRAPRIRATDF